jgi:predicted nucleotidyltransferase
MTVTLADYQNALEGLRADLQEGLGDDLISVLLYGSMARGDCKPGYSDLIDAYVYLKDEVFVEKERFVKAFETMVGACEKLSLTGLPYEHPFQYWSRDELNHTPALYRAEFWSDENSTVAFGEDVRPQMSCTEADLVISKLSFFGARRMGHHLAVYLYKKELTEEDSETILAGVRLLMKFLPAMACISLDIWTEPKQIIPSLLKALPGLNAASVQRIDAFASNRAVKVADMEELREILRGTLTFIEDLHDQILVRWGDSGVGVTTNHA